MSSSLSRRLFLSASSLLIAPPALFGAVSETDHPQSSGAERVDPASHPTFPAQDPNLVREVVGASHRDLARVKELVGARPALARATWDWGFGDWESALGAASHVGNREIAEYLISMGARPDIFSAAMLGKVDVVRAFVTLSPGIQRVKGPHSITLLSHARAGGDAAAAVVDYLTSVGGADERPALQPLSAEDRDRLPGTYRYGSSAEEAFEVTLQREQLRIARGSRTLQNLRHLGGLVFHPSGAEAVRIQFAAEGTAMTVTVIDGPLTVTARK
jgi:hypothetical protein